MPLLRDLEHGGRGLLGRLYAGRQRLHHRPDHQRQRRLVYELTRFDFEVEFPVTENPANLRITIDGEDYRGQSGLFVENERRAENGL